MRNKSPRDSLLEILKTTLFPSLNKLGFSGPCNERIDIDDVVPAEHADLFHFRKRVPGAFDQVVTIDVKSFSRPTFTISAGHVPIEGVRMVCPEEIVPPERATAVMLEVQAFLQASPKKGYSPFRIPAVSHWLGSRSAVEKTVSKAISLLPDLKKWLDTKVGTDNVWVVKFPRPQKATR